VWPRAPQDDQGGLWWRG